MGCMRREYGILDLDIKKRKEESRGFYYDGLFENVTFLEPRVRRPHPIAVLSDWMAVADRLALRNSQW